jgi:hypothetical protein
MKMGEDVRKYAAEPGIAEAEALTKGREAKSREFVNRARRFTRRFSSPIYDVEYNANAFGSPSLHSRLTHPCGRLTSARSMRRSGTSHRMATKTNRPMEIHTLTNASGMAAR